MTGIVTRYLAIWHNGVNVMSNGASKVVFFEEGKSGDLGEYLMYNPPITGDDVTWGEATYTVVRRNVDVQDNFVRITVRRKDSA